QVEYGTTTAYGNGSTLDTTMVTSHSMTLSGLLAGTVYHYRVRSRDASGMLSISADFSFITGGGSLGSCPCSVWTNAAVPLQDSTGDTNKVEVGVRFKSEVSGYIKSIRFYKGSANNGTHTASLYSSSGALLARTVSTNETVSGWQQV